MTKILMKKQLREVFAWVYQDKKTGKNRDKKGILTFSLVYIMIFGFLGVIFFKMAEMLCAPLANAGFAWLYMALMGLTGITLGVFGSVFNTYATLYQAKDNDLLLSMPIPVKSVLAARLLGVYVIGLMYELLVMIPAAIVYFLKTEITVSAVIFTVCIPFVMSFFILCLSCGLGWVIAQINSRLRNQKIITVVVSLAFIAVYYYFCGNVSTLLQSVVMHPENLADKVKGMAYPLYLLGRAAEGDVLSMAIFTASVLVVLAIVYILLKRSFIKLATSNKGAAKKIYREKTMKHVSVGRALLNKEFKRFFQSPNYMLNCGLGIVVMVIAAVLLVIKQDVVRDLLTLQLAGYEDVIALAAVSAVCMLISMNDMTAPSVSLEGKNIWLVQVLPVSGWQVLKAKLGLQCILNLIPAVLLIVCVEWILQPSMLFAVMIPVTVLLFVVLMAAVGLACNLKAPNLEWTSEIVPIKQSFSVIAVLLSGWVVVIAAACIYYLLHSHVTPGIYIIGVNILILMTDVILLYWLKGKGSRIFETLGN